MIYLKSTVIHRTTRDDQVQQRVVKSNELSKCTVIHRTTRDGQVQQRVNHCQMIYLKCTVIHRTTRDGKVQQRVVIVK